MGDCDGMGCYLVKVSFTIIKELECRRCKVLDQCFFHSFRLFSWLPNESRYIITTFQMSWFNYVFFFIIIVFFRLLCSVSFFFFELDSVLRCHYGLNYTFSLFLV